MSDRRALLASGLVLIVAAIAVALLPHPLGHAWLAALFFWSGVPIGSIGFLLIMTLVGGEWREALRPAFRAGSAALPVVAVAILPVLVAMGAIYPWIADPPEGFKGAWLQPWGFILRSVLWLGGLAAVLAVRARGTRHGAAVASIGLLFLFPMGSLVAVDWLLSLDPEFHSSGFGLQALTVQFTVALMVAVVRTMRDKGDASGTTGALMLTLLLLWGYFAYLPFFIVWSGNTPAGAAWYGARSHGGWGLVASAAALLHGVPLLALLSPTARRSARAMLACAGAALVGNALQAAWMVLPAAGPVTLPGTLAFLAALAIIGVPTLLLGTRR